MARSILLLIMLCISAAACSETLRIGAEDDWYPYSAARNGQAIGMAADIVRAAYAAVGVQVELVSLPYKRCMQLTHEDKLLGCFDTLRNPLLEEQYRWHAEPLFHARIDIYARTNAPDSPVTLKDLHGKLIAVTNGYDYGAAFDGDRTMRRDMGDSDQFALRKLAAGRVDYALVYDRIVNAALREHPELRGKIKSVGTLIQPDIYISYAKHYPGVERAIALFNTGLTKIKASGEYARIEARWQ